MKKLIFIIALFSCFISQGQSISQRTNGTVTVVDPNLFTTRSFRPPAYTDTTHANINFPTLDSAGKLIYTYDVDGYWMRQNFPRKWVRFSSAYLPDSIAGGPITTIPVVGTNPGVNLTATQFINNTFYGKQPPIASLSGGNTYEYTIGTNPLRSLVWGASRQSNTTNLSTIIVGGISQTFVNPPNPGTVIGTQAVNVPINTTTTYSNVVTASNGQSSTASTTFLYRSKYYIGYVPSSTPSDADIIAVISSNFATSFVKSGTLSAPSSSQYIIFAYPSYFGLASIKINGLLVDYTLVTRSFVNASGYSTSYNIYVSPFSTFGGVDYQIL